MGRREFLRLGALPLLAAADPATLKIKRVEPYLVKIGSRRDVVCVRIETAEGIHGWGEGTTPPNVQPVLAQIRSFEKRWWDKPPGTSKSSGARCTFWKRTRSAEHSSPE